MASRLKLAPTAPTELARIKAAMPAVPLPAPPPPGVKAAPLALTKRMTVEQACRCILRNCIAQMTANEANLAAAPEALHQMRVGLRRLRSAFSLFAGVLATPPEWRDDIDWLSAQLGAARDWDVLAGATLPRIAEQLPEGQELVLVRLAAEVRADALRAAAAEAVASPRYAALMQNLERWLRDGGWRDASTARQRRELGQPVRDYALAALERAHARLRKRGRRLRHATAQTRHRVRIAAKKTRYAAEFFESLYRKRRIAPWVTSLSALQDELGLLNDAAVADALLKNLQDGEAQADGSAAFMRGYLAADAAARRRGGQRTVRKLWKACAQLTLPR